MLYYLPLYICPFLHLQPHLCCGQEVYFTLTNAAISQLITVTYTEVEPTE